MKAFFPKNENLRCFTTANSTEKISKVSLVSKGSTRSSRNCQRWRRQCGKSQNCKSKQNNNKTVAKNMDKKFQREKLFHRNSHFFFFSVLCFALFHLGLFNHLIRPFLIHWLVKRLASLFYCISFFIFLSFYFDLKLICFITSIISVLCIERRRAFLLLWSCEKEIKRTMYIITNTILFTRKTLSRIEKIERQNSRKKHCSINKLRHAIRDTSHWLLISLNDFVRNVSSSSFSKSVSFGCIT